MPRFGKRSRAALETVRPELREIVEAVMHLASDDRDDDFSALTGRRGRDAQEDAYATGNSGAHWPESAHNCPVVGSPGPPEDWPEDPARLSRAIDLAPWPIDWLKAERFHYLAGRIMLEAARRGVPLIWGADFRSLADLGHFELEAP